MSKLQSLAQDLVRARNMLQELDNEHKAKAQPIEEAKKVIQEKLLAEMVKAKTLSTRFEDFTISRKKTVKAVVTSEQVAISALKLTGHGDYVVEAIAPQALKEIERGSLALDGVTVETREHISIRASKQDQPNAA
jgi:hypothetical protein